MTKISFDLDKENNYFGFEATGHSGYAEEGSDIVCAGISALLFTFVNSIDELTDADIEVECDDETGYMKAIVSNYKSEKVQTLFKSLHIGLKGIEDSYKKYLKLTNRREKP